MKTFQDQWPDRMERRGHWRDLIQDRREGRNDLRDLSEDRFRSRDDLRDLLMDRMERRALLRELLAEHMHNRGGMHDRGDMHGAASNRFEGEEEGGGGASGVNRQDLRDLILDHVRSRGDVDEMLEQIRDRIQGED